MTLQFRTPGEWAEGNAQRGIGVSTSDIPGSVPSQWWSCTLEDKARADAQFRLLEAEVGRLREDNARWTARAIRAEAALNILRDDISDFLTEGV